MANYPGSLPGLATNKNTSDTGHTTDHNSIADEVNAIAGELGTDPAGSESTVKARLEAIEATAVPEWLAYLTARQSDETEHALDDFFASDTTGDYTEVTVSGNATWSVSRDLLAVEHDSQTGGDGAALLIATGGLTVPVTVETAMRVSTHSANYSIGGVCFTDGTVAGSNFVGSYMSITASTRVIGHSYGTLTDVQGGDVTYVSSPLGWGVGGHVYVRVIWKSANTFNVQHSADGVVWTDSGIADASKTMTPTHLGFWVTSFGGTFPQGRSFDYIRVNESDLSA